MASGQRRTEADAAERILDIAERLVQVRGFNAFSYADVAAELNVTKASLHYHFPSKADLGEALITRYGDRFAQALASIDTRPSDARAKLDAYAKLYGDVLEGKRMCLCGMLAAEYPTLPKPVQKAVLRFFDDNEAWIEGVLLQGRREGTLRFTGSAREVARMIVSSLEGAMLVARPFGDVSRFRTAASRLLESLAAGSAPQQTGVAAGRVGGE
jgi:TetR/AcrR family transcriptional regulator, transcriptional repressor for nem operon